MSRLSGKVALVTGGARGLGAATVRAFVEQGAKVVFGDVLVDEGEALASELGPAAAFVRMDVREERHWNEAIERAQAMGPLNVLVNNAAVVHMASILHTTNEDYRRVFEINQFGTFLGIRSVIEPMKAAGGGSIINVSSIDGLHSSAGLSAYSSTKWAVRGLTKNAAIELGRYGIRVNSVHPGGMYTEMGGSARSTLEELNRDVYANFPIPRVGLPEEVAQVILFLATDEGSYCTGSEFVADGGWFAGMRNPRMPSS
ncbi:MAG: glucose 1-dehydrogenase [Spirochaetaceae bacterium]|nr:glucose 1-dehydrogenase [Myxococcales bacterium]MCB9724800.1 glucose 1-dehydrogenase [Spirochaetaceae bacterium]HPG28145.1 glucose 1-dehydrogenase [Myxococcota bacterium]